MPESTPRPPTTSFVCPHDARYTSRSLLDAHQDRGELPRVQALRVVDVEYLEALLEAPGLLAHDRLHLLGHPVHHRVTGDQLAVKQAPVRQTLRFSTSGKTSILE